MSDIDDKTLNLNTAEDPHLEDTNKEAPTPDPEIEIDDPPAELVEDPLDDLVTRINAIYVRKGLEVILEVGRFVLETVYDGDADIVSGRGTNHPTFRALAERKDLLMSHSSIWRAVRIVVQLPALPPEAETRLPYTHHTLLLPVHDERAKAELAWIAIDEGLSSRDFGDRVKEARRAKKTDKRGGSKRLPAFVRTVRKVGKLVEDEDLWGDLDAIDGMKAEEAEALYDAVAGMRLKCEEIQAALQRRLSDSERE